MFKRTREIATVVPNGVPKFLAISTLLAFLFIPVRAQVITGSSPPCVAAHPQVPATCVGWTKCDMGFKFHLISGRMKAFTSCPGYIVWNRATVSTSLTLPGLQGSAASFLQSLNGPGLRVTITSKSCSGLPFTSTSNINPCPAAPRSDDFSDVFLLTEVPSTQLACQLVGMFWSSPYQSCFPQETAQDGCETIGGFWSSFSNICSETPDPSGGPELCQSSGWFWIYTTNQCYPDPQTCGGHCAPYYPLESGGCESAVDYCSFQWGCGFGFTDGGANCCCLPTPILIDVAGDGFSLSNAYDGVQFDMGGDGHPEPIAWTIAGTDDAWLVVDRNGNGLIDSAREMFGNFTEQPHATTSRNGFVALAEFDRADQGGNNDGEITSKDSVFANLRLWQDVNHDGISQGNELKTLLSLDVATLDLKYTESKKADNNGNQFSFRAKVKDVSGAQVGRWAWDVTLSVNPPPRP